MRYSGFNDISFDVHLSPDERLVYFIASDGTARVFDLENGAEILIYEIGGWVVGSLSPDGDQIFLTSTEGRSAIYPTWQTLDELIAYAKHCCMVYELTPDEREQFGLPPN
jgi:WD40 repeat protein